MTSGEQFEAWWERERYDEKLSYVQGVMFNHIKANMFLAWQGSRETIEVELPSIEDKKWHSSWHGKFREEAFWLEVKRRLVKLGLKVKG